MRATEGDNLTYPLPRSGKGRVLLDYLSFSKIIAYLFTRSSRLRLVPGSALGPGTRILTGTGESIASVLIGQDERELQTRHR